jgi:hypothetical protein
MKWQPVLFAIGNNHLHRFRGIASEALAIDDAGRRARFTIQGFPAFHIERVMNAIQRAAPVPNVEITKQRALGRQVLGNVTPLQLLLQIRLANVLILKFSA